MANPHVGSYQASSTTTSDPEEFVYTPPESIDSKASSTNDHVTTTLTTATHSTSPPAVAGAANISVRKYIYYLPYPLPPGTPIPYSTGLPSKNPLNLPPHQFEPTSTLVLTSPNHTFVDIRLFKPQNATSASPLPNRGEPARLDWAFAGTSASVALPNSPDRQGVSHTTWTHWLDSQYAVGSPVPVDEGDMYPIDDDLTLEHGHAFDPALGTDKSHEELWRDVETLAVPVGGAGKKVCVVLRVQDDKHGVRGVVVRVGQFVQGIVMRGEEVAVERWEWTENAGTAEASTGWTRTARVGDLWVPCRAACREEVLAVGGTVKFQDYEWVVEEAWEWV